MAVSITIQNYLDKLGVNYTLLTHDHTESSIKTAAASRVQGSRLVKAVIISDDDGYMMVILPATHHLHLSELKKLLGREVALATEEEFAMLFDDCEIGALPALGIPYGLEVIVEDSLIQNGELYFEGGDHETLVRMQAEAFNTLVVDEQHGHFSHCHNSQISRNGLRHSNI